MHKTLRQYSERENIYIREFEIQHIIYKYA